jgi:AcrR family transcriptional regulator
MSARTAATDIGEHPASASRMVGTRGGKRRKDIFTALHDCVIEKGYAKTTLADVARAAGMSPSHLLYYFPGKDAILESYFADVSQRIVERMRGFRVESPERQIVLLAELFFGGKNVSKSEIGFMLECFGAAVHDRRLNSEKTQLDRFCKSYLQELFEKLPCGSSRARDSAEVAYAMLVGLRTAAYFDERLSPEHARRLFSAQVMNLANLAPGGQAGKPRGR